MFNFKINEAFIIAEAGVNHEGSLKEALKLAKMQKNLVLMQLNFKHTIQNFMFLKAKRSDLKE